MNNPKPSYPAHVLCGIDRVTEPAFCRLLYDKRLALVSNSLTVSPAHGYLSTVDLLPSLFRVSRFLAPEHGVRGAAGPGVGIADGKDPVTGIETVSMFNGEWMTETGRTDNSVLDGIDACVFDLPDVGCRYFTYASTLYHTMRLCDDAGIPVIVLDRPNPLGGVRTEGRVQDNSCRSFIGLVPVPIRHGLTVGEIANYLKRLYFPSLALTVVPVSGWTRDMMLCDTDLPFVNPSPNLPSFEAVCLYPGTCMLAGTNVSEGRGTTTPFVTVGAPYIHSVELASVMNGLRLPGVFFIPTDFEPRFSKYTGTVCHGVRVHVSDPHGLAPVELGVRLIDCLRELYPNGFSFNQPTSPGSRYHVDLSTGSSELRENRIGTDAMLSGWQQSASCFAESVKRDIIYPIAD